MIEMDDEPLPQVREDPYVRWCDRAAGAEAYRGLMAHGRLLDYLLGFNSFSFYQLVFVC
jgi:hypothetical protein